MLVEPLVAQQVVAAGNGQVVSGLMPRIASITQSYRAESNSAVGPSHSGSDPSRASKSAEVRQAISRAPCAVGRQFAPCAFEYRGHRVCHDQNQRQHRAGHEHAREGRRTPCRKRSVRAPPGQRPPPTNRRHAAQCAPASQRFPAKRAVRAVRRRRSPSAAARTAADRASAAPNATRIIRAATSSIPQRAAITWPRPPPGRSARSPSRPAAASCGRAPIRRRRYRCRPPTR